MRLCPELDCLLFSMLAPCITFRLISGDTKEFSSFKILENTIRTSSASQRNVLDTLDGLPRLALPPPPPDTNWVCLEAHLVR